MTAVRRSREVLAFAFWIRIRRMENQEMSNSSAEGLVIFIVVALVVLLVVGCVKKNPLALWVGEVLIMGATLALVKALFGTKGYIRGSTGRPRIRR
jgi:hypothetical protein